MIKTIIVDDEPAAIELIKVHLAAFAGNIEICCACNSVADAIAQTKLHAPDLLLLDIELGDGLSFEILEQLPGLKAKVVFITAYDHYALKAIKFHAYDYILKPLIPAEITQTLANITEDAARQADHSQLLQYLKNERVQKIGLPVRNGLEYYATNDIVYIRGEGSYATVFLTDDRKVVVSKNLKDFEQHLSGIGFLRVHKSYFVNTKHIHQLHKNDGGYIIMSDNSNIPLGSKDRNVIVERIKDHIITI